MARVLLLEDDQDVGEMVSWQLNELFHMEVVWVKGVEEAGKVLADRHDFQAAAFDYNVIGGTSEGIVELFVKLNGCPTVAISNNRRGQEILTRAGCRYRCPKEDLPNFLGRLIT